MNDDKPGSGARGRYDPIFASVTNQGRGELTVKVKLSAKADRKDKMGFACGPIGPTTVNEETYIALFEGVKPITLTQDVIPVVGTDTVDGRVPITADPGPYGLFGRNEDAGGHWFLLCTFYVE